MIENIADEKILVTGGTGFLGKYVVEELIAKGAAPTILTRNPQTKVFKNLTGKLKLVEIDLFDFSRLTDFLEKFRPDRIIHLAGYTFQTDKYPDVFEKINYEATAKLLEAAVSVKAERIIIIGTADEYGFQNCPQSETMAAKPVSEYAASKNKAVDYALSLHAKSDLPVVILRPFTIYGIGQPAKMFVSQAIECAVRGIPFEMSKGEQKRDLLFVSDFVNAIIKFLTASGVEGEIFNVGSGQAIALETLARRIWEIAGADEKLLKIGARPTGGNELHDTQADISKISQTLGWQPTVSLGEGLKTVIENAIKNLR